MFAGKWDHQSERAKGRWNMSRQSKKQTVYSISWESATFSPRRVCLFSPLKSSRVIESNTNRNIFSMENTKIKAKRACKLLFTKKQAKEKRSWSVRRSPILSLCVSHGYEPTPRLFRTRIALLCENDVAPASPIRSRIFGLFTLAFCELTKAGGKKLMKPFWWPQPTICTSTSLARGSLRTETKLAFFALFCRVGGSEKRVHGVHLVHRRLVRSILASELAKNEIWRRNDWKPMAQFVMKWRIMAGGLCTWRWQYFFWWTVRSACEDASRRCALWKKKFLTNGGRKESAPSQRDPPAKKIMLAHFFAPKWQQNIVCSVIALLALQWEDFSNGLFIVLVALAVVKTLLFLYESQLLAFSRLRNSSIFFQVTRSLEHTKASLWKNT